MIREKRVERKRKSVDGSEMRYERQWNEEYEKKRVLKRDIREGRCDVKNMGPTN